ncbi:MAG: DUF790 family protein [Thermofilaceae archaeon]
MLEMLPSNLLVASVKKSRVEPLLLEPEGLPLAIASEILAKFAESIGRTLKEIEISLQELEELALESGLDLRVVKAMMTLAARAAMFEPVKLPVDPLRARFEIFEEVGKNFGVVVGEEERKVVLKKVAARLGCRVEDLELALEKYQEEVLVKAPSLTPEDLVRKFNLSMVQTLLFKATQLDFKVKSGGLLTKQLLRYTKMLGLLYMAESSPDSSVRLQIDGPASLLRQVRRYGIRLAKLVPYIMSADQWEIRADILSRNRKLLFQLDSSQRELFAIEMLELEPVFDSEVEKEFYKSLSRLAPSWKVEREPEPLVVDNKIFIPDFSVTSGELKVYIEIVGFWTKEYLERKLEKLRKLKDVKMIVAVDEELACSSLKQLPHEVILFKRRLRGADIYPLLKRFLGEPRQKGKTFDIDLETLKTRLPDLSGKTLQEAVKNLEDAGISMGDAVEILEKLGYFIDWNTLDPRKAKLKRS